MTKKREAQGADSQEMLTATEVARWLRIPKSTIYKLAQEGQVPAKKIGRHWRFDRRTLKAWLAQNDAKGRRR